MSAPTTVTVPALSTGLCAKVVYDLELAFGGTEPDDGQEAVTFATGGVVTATVNPDGSVLYIATGETGTDTATVTDQNETVTTSLTVAANTPVGEEQGAVTYVAIPQTAAAAGSGTAGTAAAGVGSATGSAA